MDTDLAATVRGPVSGFEGPRDPSSHWPLWTSLTSLCRWHPRGVPRGSEVKTFPVATKVKSSFNQERLDSVRYLVALHRRLNMAGGVGTRQIAYRFEVVVCGAARAFKGCGRLTDCKSTSQLFRNTIFWVACSPLNIPPTEMKSVEYWYLANVFHHVASFEVKLTSRNARLYNFHYFSQHKKTDKAIERGSSQGHSHQGSIARPSHTIGGFEMKKSQIHEFNRRWAAFPT